MLILYTCRGEVEKGELLGQLNDGVCGEISSQHLRAGYFKKQHDSHN